MRKIKVLFVADMLIPDLDGASRTMFQLIDRISPDRYEYLFICGTGPDRIGSFECVRVASFKVIGNSTYRMATTLFQRLDLDMRIDRFSPDVIHISTPSPLGNYALKVAKKLGVPVISIYHTHFVSYVDYYIRDFPALLDFTKEKVKTGMRNFYNQCDLVYVPSKSIMTELEATGIRPDVFKLWQRGIDHRLFSPARYDPFLMKDITGNDDPCILFASRLVWEKNLQTMIDLYRLLKDRNLLFNFVVAGEGVAQDELKRQMPDAFFLGRLEHGQLAKVYASSDVFFFPSVTETFGNVVLEAMASGLPCVIADGGGSRDFITNGENGFKCTPTDAEDFLEKIMRILNQQQLKNSFKRAGIETSKKYTWENLANEYFEDLKSLAIQLSVG